MRFSVFFLSLLFCMPVSCKKQEQSTASSQPKSIPVKSTLQQSYFLKHHFGDVNVDEMLTCSLELKNEMDKPMLFGFSNTSCGGCLSVKSMPTTIEPSETGIFELEFNTAGKRGATPQHAYFWDAEPKTILVVADITATVRAVWTDPDVIGLGNLSTNEPHKTKFYVMVAGYPDAKVVSAKTDAPWLTLVSNPVETSKELKSQNILAIDYYEVEWTGNDAKPGNLATKIMIQVQNGDEDKTLEIPVTGYLSGDVEIVPSNIVFGRVAQNEVVRTCTLTFKKPDIDATKIQCFSDHPSVQTLLEKDKGQSNQFSLTTKIVPPAEINESLIEGTITGKDQSGEVLFSIPYIAFFDPSLSDGQK